MKSIIKSIMVMFLLILGMQSVMATTGLNVVLANQNPDPVSPGNFVYVNVKLSNSGSTGLSNVEISMEENSVFSLALGEKDVREIGTLPVFSSLEGSESYQIEKFKVLVDDDAPLGLNEISFNVLTNGISYHYEFDILVQDVNPTIQVVQFGIDEVEAGKSGKLILELQNDNSITLKDLVVTLGLDQVEDTVLNVVSGSNQIVIPTLKSKDSITTDFELVVSPDASSKPYQLPLTLAYEDSLGNQYTQNVLGSVQVYSKPLVTLDLDSQTIYSTGKGKVSLALANPGTSTVKGTQITILPGSNYQIIEGDFQYIGDLNPDDFQTAQVELYVKEEKETILNVKLTYLDSYNQKSEKTLHIPLKVFNKDQLKQFGLDGTEGSSSSPMTIVLLILAVIAFFIGRKFGYKKGKTKQ